MSATFEPDLTLTQGLRVESSVRSSSKAWCRSPRVPATQEFAGRVSPRQELPNELTPPAGMFVIAHLGDRPVGCEALKFHLDAGRAEANVDLT